jgi:hypothetical protein
MSRAREPRPAAPRRLSPFAALFAAALALGACEDVTVPDEPDGGFLFGDAARRDLGPRDALLPPDTGMDPFDAAPRDVALRDFGVRDTGVDLGVDVGDGGLAPVECRPRPARVFTASAAIDAAATSGDTFVAVDAVRGEGPASCAPIACPEDTPCCAPCSAAVFLDAVVEVASSSCAPQVGCLGDICGLACAPPISGLRERHIGRLRPGPRLELFAIEPVPALRAAGPPRSEGEE